MINHKGHDWTKTQSALNVCFVLFCLTKRRGLVQGGHIDDIKIIDRGHCDWCTEGVGRNLLIVCVVGV